MNRPLSPLLAGLLFLMSACSSPTDLEPGESCIGRSSGSIARVQDANLEARIKGALGVNAGSDLTCGLVARLTELNASQAGITSLVGIQNLVNLNSLDLSENQIDELTPLAGLNRLSALLARSAGMTSLDGIEGLTKLTFLDLSENSIDDVNALSGLTNLWFLDLSDNRLADLGPLSGLTTLRLLYLDQNEVSNLGPLSGLTSLTTLWLGTNSITDIGPLSELKSLTTLYLDANSIVDVSALAGLPAIAFLDLTDNSALNDIQPLLDNPNLGTGDTVDLRGTAVSCPSVESLQAKGGIVLSGCP